MKTLQGTVVSDVNNKTIVVNVLSSKIHPLYKKRYSTNKKYTAHDEKNVAKKGDVVIIAESKPISKTKTWILSEVIGTEVLRYTEEAPEVVAEEAAEETK